MEEPRLDFKDPLTVDFQTDAPRGAPSPPPQTQRSGGDVMSDFMQNVSSDFKQLSVQDVPKSLEGIATLVRNGRWKAVDDLADTCLVMVDGVAERWQYHLARIVASVHLRSYSQALQLAEQRLADPTLLEGAGDSVPFSLLLLHSKLPACCGKPLLATDRLTELHQKCRAALKEASDSVDSATWQRRLVWVSYALSSHLASQGDLLSALDVLSDLESSASDPVVLSKIGMLYLQVGAVKAAEHVFDKVDCLSAPTPLVKRNRALLQYSMGLYTEAAAEFDAAFRSNASDTVAACGLATCLVHLQNTDRAIEVLEETIKADPFHNATYRVVRNLCLLYDVQSDATAKKKAALRRVVDRVTPDDFDFAAFTITTG